MQFKIWLEAISQFESELEKAGEALKQGRFDDYMQNIDPDFLGDIEHRSGHYGEFEYLKKPQTSPYNLPAIPNPRYVLHQLAKEYAYYQGDEVTEKALQQAAIAYAKKGPKALREVMVELDLPVTNGFRVYLRRHNHMIYNSQANPIYLFARHAEELAADLVNEKKISLEPGDFMHRERTAAGVGSQYPFPDNLRQHYPDLAKAQDDWLKEREERHRKLRSGS